MPLTGPPLHGPGRGCSKLGLGRMSAFPLMSSMTLPAPALRRKKRLRPWWWLQPLMILEDGRQLFAEPDAARLSVESTMPVQLQVIGDVERRQRRHHLIGERRKSGNDRVRERCH